MLWGITQSACKRKCWTNTDCLGFEYSATNGYTRCQLQTVRVTRVTPFAGAICLLKFVQDLGTGVASPYWMHVTSPESQQRYETEHTRRNQIFHRMRLLVPKLASVGSTPQ